MGSLITYELLTPDQESLDAIRGRVSHIVSQTPLAAKAHLVNAALGELIQNAIKANLKRAHLEQTKFYSPTDAQLAEAEFRDRLQRDMDSMLRQARDARKSVKVIFEQKGDVWRFLVRNDSVMTAPEAERLRAQLRDKKSDTMTNQLESGGASEGAGIGLNMVQTLLEKLNLSPLRFQPAATHTEFEFQIPLKMSEPANSAVPEPNKMPSKPPVRKVTTVPKKSSAPEKNSAKKLSKKSNKKSSKKSARKSAKRSPAKKSSVKKVSVQKKMHSARKTKSKKRKK